MEMRALVVKRFGGPEVLEVVDAPVPVPGTGEVLVRVTAAAVHPHDLMVRSGAMVAHGVAVPAGQVSLGADVVGTVEAVGAGVFGIAAGDDVVGLEERLDLPYGVQAEYVVLPQWAVAPAPRGVSPELAAALPLDAITADQALAELCLKPGQWLLVTGAAGAVGGFAVELARMRGLRVVAQAAPGDEKLVRGFGAELVVSRDVPLAPAVRALVPGGADGALDAANLGVVAMDAIRHGGAFAALLNNAPMARRGIRSVNVAWTVDGGRLAELSALAEAGRLTPRVAATYPLERAAEAHEALARGGSRGRHVLIPALR